MIFAILGGVFVAFMLGSLVGYVIGREEGEEEVVRYYEKERKAW